MNLKKKITLTISVFAAIMLGLVYFIILPTLLDIKKISDEIETQKISLEKQYLKGQNLRKLSANIKTIEPEINKLDEVFIKKDSSLEFVAGLEAIAERHGLEQKINLAANQEIREKNYFRLPMQLAISGDWSAQMQYLADLESLKYFINIKELEISTLSRQKSDGRVNTIIFADTYWK